VSDTVFFAGTAKGAVYVVVPPLAVCEGEKEPQFGGLPQIATQSTPALAMSLVTEAERVVVPPTCKEAGGACVMATEIIGVCEMIVFAELLEQPAMPSREGRPITSDRTVRQKFNEECCLSSRWVLIPSTEPIGLSETLFDALGCKRSIITSCPFPN